jgi:tetratricopeptide (TPR) repeat protein
MNSLRDFDQALKKYEECTIINPKCHHAYMSLGYTYHLKFDVITALRHYHKAHFLKNDDSLIEELIRTAMEDINNSRIGFMSD